MYWGHRTTPRPNETRGGYGRKAERNAAMVADYLAGIGTPTLARRYGVSQQRAHMILTNAGIVLRRPRQAERP